MAIPKMGLGGRLAVTFAALMAVSALLIGGASYLTTDREVSQEIDRFLRNRSTEIAEGQRSVPRVGTGQRPSNETAPVLSVDADAEVQLLDKQGNILASTGLVLPVDTSDRSVAERREPDYLHTVVVDEIDYRIITAHIEGGGAVQVARSLEDSNGLLGALQTRLLVIACAMAVLGAAGGWFMAQRTTRPLRSLTLAVDAVADTRNFSVPIESIGTDEVGRLGAGFDRMLRALKLSQEQQHRLVQDAAHELRTPLTSIKANVDWLTVAGDIDAHTRQETMESVSRELNELGGLIEEIVELAIDTHELPPFQQLDLADVAASAVELLRARSDRRVDLSSSPSLVDGDFDTLRRAITNLLSNADKYSPTDEPVVIEVSAGAVWVSDGGPGIPVADRAHVFERFYRGEADRSQPGSGLGLAIVASIVEAHGGEVGVSDTAAGGARVGFTLPFT